MKSLISIMVLTFSLSVTAQAVILERNFLEVNEYSILEEKLLPNIPN